MNPLPLPAEAVDTSATSESVALPDWTPEQQIARMLELCEAQTESALAESDIAVETLMKAFSAMDETIRCLSEATAGLHGGAASTKTADAGQQLAAVKKQMAAAVVAFQFYDKLTQRLGHVRHSLTTLATFVCDRAQSSQLDQWSRLFRTLQRQYRTEEERQIFKMIVEGASPDEAREHIHQTTATLRIVPGGDIELF